MDFNDEIRRDYLDEGHPLYLAYPRRIYNWHEGHHNEDSVKNFLQGNDTYTLHKQFKRGQRNVSYTTVKRGRFECDLVDVRHLAKYNDNVNYLFTCIDTFTRYAFVRMLESKHGSCAVRAFQSILDEAKTPPRILVMDRGTEFYNDDFKKFVESRGIKYYPPDSSSHGAYIERFNRTLQNLIYRHMTLHETYRFIKASNAKKENFDMMPFFLATYNNSHHRMIGTTPAIAENDESTHLEIRKKMLEYRSKIKKRKPTFKVGDTVRIKRIKGKFGRGYNEQATEEIWRIYKIKTNMPIPMYILMDYDRKNKIRGSFYANELVKVDVENKSFKIERVIKKRKIGGVIQLFVKWKGWPDTYNSWINESDITQTF